MSCDGFLNLQDGLLHGQKCGAFEYGLNMQGNEIGK